MNSPSKQLGPEFNSKSLFVVLQFLIGFLLPVCFWFWFFLTLGIFILSRTIMPTKERATSKG